MVRLKLFLALLSAIAWFSVETNSSDAQLFRCFRGNSGCCGGFQRCRPMRCLRPARCCVSRCCPQTCRPQPCCPQPCCPQPSCGCVSSGGAMLQTPTPVGPLDQSQIPQDCQQAYTKCLNDCQAHCGGPQQANCEAYCSCARKVCNGTGSGPCTAPPCLVGGTSGEQ